MSAQVVGTSAHVTARDMMGRAMRSAHCCSTGRVVCPAFCLCCIAAAGCLVAFNHLSSCSCSDKSPGGRQRQLEFSESSCWLQILVSCIIYSLFDTLYCSFAHCNRVQLHVQFAFSTSSCQLDVAHVQSQLDVPHVTSSCIVCNWTCLDLQLDLLVTIVYVVVRADFLVQESFLSYQSCAG